MDLTPMNKKTVINFAVIGIVLTSIVGTLTNCTGIDEIHWYNLIDQVQRTYFPGSQLNDYIIKDPKLLDNRVERDVDNAIEEYERLTGDTKPVRIQAPIYIEKPIDPKLQTGESRLLGGEMRICAPWIIDCINEE